MKHLYSITPLDINHIDQICEDVKDLYEKGISIPLFYMKLHAEGKPPIDKTTPLCNKYLQFKEKLDAIGVPSGILVQSSLGHGYPLNNPISFTPLKNLNDGEETFVGCPADERLREYLKNAFRQLATCHPSVIMIDDDFRLLYRQGHGCACHLHMAEFNRRTGLNMTREELWNYTQTHPINDPITRVFSDTQKDSLYETICAIREGIDEIDPTIQGAICVGGNFCEFGALTGKAFAGKGNPTIVRVPNGIYAPQNMRGFSNIAQRSARTITKLKREGVDVILAETDTIPFNRYGKSATVLHAQFTTDLLDGCTGAKHWFTRLSAYEPDSGKAYRKTLNDHKGMYERITELAPKIKWVGAAVPFEVSTDFSFHRERTYNWPEDNCSFSEFFLERIGVPFYFTDETANVSFLSSSIDYFSDESLDKIFSGNVILSSECVEPLTKRGYAKYLGVSTRKWTGATITGEELSNGGTCQNQMNLLELVPEKEIIADSFAYHLENDVDRVHLFPATAIYKREDAKTTITFAGTPKAPFTYTQGFSFLNESRKKQMVKILLELGALPLYYTGDSEVFLRAGMLSDKEYIVAPFALGWDILENLPLWIDAEVEKVVRINGKGEDVPVDFEKSGKDITINCPIKPIHPEVFIITIK